MPIFCHRILGQLPPVLPRSVVFFANLQSIFFENTQETAVLSNMVHGIETYGGRLLPILNLLYPSSDNLLVLERQPAPELVSWFGEIGLDLPTFTTLRHHQYCDARNPRMCDVRAELIAQPAPWVDGYVTDNRLCEIARDCGKQTRSNPGASRRGNNKFRLHQFLAEAGLPVFDSEIANSAKEVDAGLARLRDAGYAQACVKAAIGASGIGLQKLPTDVSCGELADYFFADDPCLVQGWIDETHPGVERVESPSVQLWLDDDWLAMYDLTSQILSADSIHEGNAAPPLWQASHPDLVDELLRQAELAASWLHDQGYRGAASIDFHLAWQSAGEVTVRICEINARVTGATYPSLLARKLSPDGAWRMQNLHFPQPLPCEDLLAALRSEPGLVPINANLATCGLVEKCQLLALAPRAAGCLALLDRLEHILPVEYLHDRD